MITIFFVIHGIFQMGKGKKDRNILTLSPLIFIVGFVVVLIFSIIVFILLATNADVGLCILFSLFTLLGFYCCVGYANTKLEFNRDGFSYRNSFGISRSYQYADVKSYLESVGNSTTYIIDICGGKKVCFSDELVDAERFIGELKEGYRRAHPGEELPERGYKLFNDNIEHPGEFIAVNAVINVLLVILLVFVLQGPQSPESFEQLHRCPLVVEKQWAEEDDGWYFKARGSNAKFRISNQSQNNYGTHTALRSISAGTPIVAYLFEIPERFDHEQTLQIYCLRTADESFDYLSFSDWQKGQEEKNKVAWFFCGLLVLNNLFWGFGFYVMSHAPHFPKIVQWYVQPSYLRYKNQRKNWYKQKRLNKHKKK